MNLIVSELLISVIGIPIDFWASVSQGWKLGRGPCLTCGFTMTLMGEYLKYGLKEKSYPSLLNSLHHCYLLMLLSWYTITKLTDGFGDIHKHVDIRHINSHISTSCNIWQGCNCKFFGLGFAYRRNGY